jgi:undecaprenyl-diphosphatase
MPGWLQVILDWVSHNPTWAGVVIFLVAMSESLLIVGVLVPGAALMIGIGMLIGLGGLDMLTTLLWAIAGAIVGDGISYWIGRVFRDRLRNMWPLSRYPAMLSRGEAFFIKHGGKSIVFGRFVGPVRAVIPTVAGIMGMPPTRFTVVNVVSAIGWAPAYILPGAVLGTSLTLASQVAARLGILLVTLIAVLWLTAWLVVRSFRFFQPRAASMLDRLLRWGRAHPRLGRLVTALLDPQRPEAAALIIVAALLGFTAWLLFASAFHVAEQNRLTALDESVYHIMQNLRTPWADQLLVALSDLGDLQVTVPLTLAMLAWLSWRRFWLAAGHWLAALLFVVAFTVIFKESLAIPRPTAVYQGLAQFAFPSGHTAIVTVLYGFFAVLIAHALPRELRWLPYTVAGIVVSGVGFSRVYLGAHWLTDILGGLALGLTWTVLVSVAYRRHAVQPVPAAPALTLLASVLLVAGAWHIHFDHSRALARYAPTVETRSIATQAWWQDQWQRLPAFRVDLKGEPLQPLNIQWAGTLPSIQAQLSAQGWQPAVGFSVAKSLLHLAPDTSLEQLPILPMLHNGHHDNLTMLRRNATGLNYDILRLWPANATLDGVTPLWIGFVSDIEAAHLPLVTYARSGKDFTTPLRLLAEPTPGIRSHLASRERASRQHRDADIEWSGAVLLLQTSSDPDGATTP